MSSRQAPSIIAVSRSSPIAGSTKPNYRKTGIPKRVSTLSSVSGRDIEADVHKIELGDRRAEIVRIERARLESGLSHRSPQRELDSIEPGHDDLAADEGGQGPIS